MSPPAERSGPHHEAAPATPSTPILTQTVGSRRTRRDHAEAYAKGFSAGWTDRAEYERRARFAGDDYLAGYRDGLNAAGGGRHG